MGLPLAELGDRQAAPTPRAIAYEKSGRWFTAEEPLLRAKERTDAGSSAFWHPRSELIAPLPQEVEPAFNNRKLHMRLPCPPATFSSRDGARIACGLSTVRFRTVGPSGPHCDPGGLAVSGRRARPLLPPGGRLGNGRADAPGADAGRLGHGDQAAPAAAWTDAPFRPRQPICCRCLSETARRARHRLLNEPQRELLG